MDGFTGFKTATTEELPDATPVLDPFHVVRLAGDALDRCRRRVQQDLHGHRGRAGDRLYRVRRMLHTGVDLLTPRQQTRLETLFADDDHVEVETTWGIYQKMVRAYREPDRAKGRTPMQAVIDALSSGVPSVLTELIVLGRPDEAGLRHPRLLRPTRNFERSHRSAERPTRTPPRQRPGLAQPHQLHRTQPAQNRQIQTPTTPCNVMNP